MSIDNIMPGGCTNPTGGSNAPASGSTGVAGGALDALGGLGAVGGLAQAAMNGQLGAALTAMAKQKAVEMVQQAATAALMKIFTVTADPKPPKPSWTGLGQVTPPGSADAIAALDAWNSVHQAPDAPAAGAAASAAGGAAAGNAGGGSGNSGGGNGQPVSSGSQTPASKPINPEDFWVDMSPNDLLHAAVALAMMPAALVLRSLAGLFPETMNSLFAMLPKSSAGTGDKTGIGGFFGGNNDREGTAGAVGIAFSLTHQLFKALGLGKLGDIFEKGQKEHDRKTGINLITGESIAKSDSTSSAGHALGQLLGIMARNVGMGKPFYKLVKALMGPPEGYDFVTGVAQGAHQKFG